jgi:hypothetical protein
MVTREEVRIVTNDIGSEIERSVIERLQSEILSWPGVSEGEHEFGGVEFRLGKREIGHLHDDLELADLPFPRRVRDELVSEGRAMPHHIFPDTGWVSYQIDGEATAPGALALFRLSYERAVAAQRPDGGDEAP